ncbi:hypothetical protein DRN86_04980 [Candidatus Geothermarchaeota archaeon]|nr:MAG: hypothetical protein DRN86_04980 [Candidatus Geothermarchaeota archaeon]
MEKRKIDYEALHELAPELAGFLPKKTRRRLFQLLYESFEKRGKKIKKTDQEIIEDLAELLETDPQTIISWKERRSPPEGVSVLLLLEAALRIEPKKALEILIEDLEKHRELLEKIAGKPQVEKRKIIIKINARDALAFDNPSSAIEWLVSTLLVYASLGKIEITPLSSKPLEFDLSLEIRKSDLYLKAAMLSDIWGVDLEETVDEMFKEGLNGMIIAIKGITAKDLFG